MSRKLALPLRNRCIIVTALVLANLMVLPGCRLARSRIDLPSKDQFQREQLKVFSDIRLPRRHRLFDELTARREDIANKLLLPSSDEPINIYVFNDAERFKDYMKQNHPDFPERRAFFVKNDTSLKVFAHWGDRVAEDLRHEVTHGYLHSVVPSLPLWMDEGLAEYFEVPRGTRGVHRQHIFNLVAKVKEGSWKPNLQRLEQMQLAHEMDQTDYAEAWLWMHFLLESDDETCKLVQDQLARLRMTGSADSMSTHVAMKVSQPDEAVLDHLADLAKGL